MNARRATYSADDARSAIEAVTEAIDNLAAIMPILDALATAPRWTIVEEQAMRAAGTIIQSLAEDVALRARLLGNHYRG